MATNIRNIDFEALKSLRDRHGSVFTRGRVIFRQGDTDPDFYVVLQGAVELSLSEKATGSKQVLLVARAGDFFGEMACFGGSPRSTDAIALEDNTVLLHFNQDTAVQLLRASPRFALGVIQRLCDRVNIANTRISELNAQLAGAPAPAAAAPAQAAAGQAPATMAAQAASAARPGAPPAIKDVPPSNYDKQRLWGKQVVCPISNTRFMALNVRPEAIKVQTRESDFHEIYASISPLWYLVYVCPECAFAAYPDDFANATPDEVAAIQARGAERGRLATGQDLAGERTLESASIAFRLAVDCYELRAPNYQRMGGVYHRLAWLAREAGDAENERAYLGEALKQYLIGWEKARPTDPTTELMMLYTIGDLHLRMGSAAEAVRWLHQASQHASFKLQPEIQRLTRERWGDARASARPR